MKGRSPEEWDRRYQEGHHQREDPSNLLIEWEPDFPQGRALDVACGAGRNAIFLAERGYSVDAIDYSGEALDTGRRRAEERGVEVNWIRADLDQHEFTPEEYDLVVVAFFHLKDNLSKIKRSLKRGGVFLYEHHLQTEEPVDTGPKNSELRFGPNELLENFLDFRVLFYEEGVEVDDQGRKIAVVRLVARKLNP